MTASTIIAKPEKTLDQGASSRQVNACQSLPNRCGAVIEENPRQLHIWTYLILLGRRKQRTACARWEGIDLVILNEVIRTDADIVDKPKLKPSH